MKEPFVNKWSNIEPWTATTITDSNLSDTFSMENLLKISEEMKEVPRQRPIIVTTEKYNEIMDYFQKKQDQIEPLPAVSLYGIPIEHYPTIQEVRARELMIRFEEEEKIDSSNFLRSVVNLDKLLEPPKQQD